MSIVSSSEQSTTHRKLGGLTNVEQLLQEQLLQDRLPCQKVILSAREASARRGPAVRVGGGARVTGEGKRGVEGGAKRGLL